MDVLVLGDVGRVRMRTDEEEVVAPGVPGWRLGNALVDGDLFGGGGVSDADVDGAVFEVVD